VDWAVSPRIIEVAAPSVTISIQDLWDTCRQLEAELVALDDEVLIHESSGGKISAGAYTVVITLVLNNAKLKFEARGSPAVCTVTEGIFGAVDDVGDPIDPREFSTNTNVDISQAVSGSIDRVEVDDLKFRIETLRQTHMAFGKTVYWDHLYGNDTNSGLYESAPVLTFARAHEIAEDNGNDVVLNAHAYQNDITEAITITKNSLHLRMGRVAAWNVPGEDAITITGNAVSVEGAVISSCARGIVVSGMQQMLRDCTIMGATGHGVLLDGIQFSLLSGLVITDCGGDGIRIKGATTDLSHLLECRVRSCGGNGLTIEDGDDFALCERSAFTGCTGYGVQVLSDAVRTLFMGELMLYDNTAGDFDDQGTDTQRQEIATRELAKQIREKNIRRYLVRAVADDATRNVSIGDWNYEQVIIKNDVDADFGSPVDSSQRKVAYEKTYAEDPNHDRPFYYIGHD
jgi:hypothetical protein